MDRVIEKRIVIHAKPEIVYRALTESGSLGRWLADRAVSYPVVGGTLDIARGDGDSLDGARALFIQLVPNRMVRIRWQTRVKAGVSQAVSGDHECAFAIDENPEGVVVRMSDEESPAPPDPERLKREQTWDETLVALKSLCEGPDAPRPEMAGPSAAPARRAPKPLAAARPAPKKAARAKPKKAKRPKAGKRSAKARVKRKPAKRKPAKRKPAKRKPARTTKRPAKKVKPRRAAGKRMKPSARRPAKKAKSNKAAGKRKKPGARKAKGRGTRKGAGRAKKR